MEKITMVGGLVIDYFYQRLREIDFVRDMKMDGVITREDLSEAAKKGIRTSIQFSEGSTSSCDTIQKLYLKLQALDKADGRLDGDIKALRPSRVLFIQGRPKITYIQLEVDVFISDEKKELILAKVNADPDTLKEMDPSLKKDKDFILEAVKRSAAAMKYADASFSKDKEFLLTAFKYNRDVLKYADVSVKKDKSFILAAVKESRTALEIADEALRKDKEVMLAAVKQDGHALEYADASLKKDKEVVRAAAGQNAWAAFYHADSSLKNDKGFILEAAGFFGGVLEFADEALKKDKEVVLACVKENGQALMFADHSLKRDKDVVITAVKQYGKALQSSYQLLNNDKEVVLAAVKQDGEALCYADDLLRKDKEVVLAAIRQNSDALKYADDLIRKDKEVVLTAVKQNAATLEFADESLWKDKDVITASIPGLQSIFDSNMSEKDYLSLLVSNMLVMRNNEETDASLGYKALSGSVLLSSYRTVIRQIEKTGLRGLSNIDPDSAVKLTSTMAEVFLRGGYWATQSKNVVMRDVRLTEMSKNSAVLRLLAHEGKLNLRSETSFIFAWSHAPSISVNLPSNVYWYKKDIPELRGLLNSKYEVYKNAAAKALEKLDKEGVEDQGLEAGKKPSPEKLQALRKMMESDDWTLRYRALEALRISGADTGEFTQEILKLFNDKEWYVHNSAALIIEKDGEKHMDYLNKVKKNGSEYASFRALQIIWPDNK
ncbi:MAG: DUF4116 domain-containing protein [Candidatus Saganbacteria bacterium]|nr:DUF4116 domain-containing protein [Candidatus Saganbacteria bacterium]